ncbi:uncharacterized protein BO95DRAFT_429086 [Aspergillus brunneoviolaceus CBS 621.78]|uniref:Uncharacterized protein n=1 Tax=Aspergillus brunneoviolaceus CBS 621.78 TaxID=1450534 RepID=A0ACD1GHY0_9EURO|nr:hypothetical protein BO95DRAFT_429086 [Aspergillus brunneoviolaceus CBS 621.78]RAH48868.1 hypothetical protein BO95DRAFT_429086 [Aspergillus brunneoviolaceus CBS 621.78]
MDIVRVSWVLHPISTARARARPQLSEPSSCATTPLDKQTDLIQVCIDFRHYTKGTQTTARFWDRVADDFRQVLGRTTMTPAAVEQVVRAIEDDYVRWVEAWGQGRAADRGSEYEGWLGMWLRGRDGFYAKIAAAREEEEEEAQERRDQLAMLRMPHEKRRFMASKASEASDEVPHKRQRRANPEESERARLFRVIADSLEAESSSERKVKEMEHEMKTMQHKLDRMNHKIGLILKHIKK